MGLRLEIRKLEKEDLPFLATVRNECRLYLHNQDYFTINQVVEWFNSLEYPYFLIALDGEKVGYFRTSKWMSDGSVCIGADLAAPYRGRGLAKAAYYLFLDHLYTALNINRVWLEVLNSNPRAFNLYKDLGFKVIGQDGTSTTMEKLRSES